MIKTLVLQAHNDGTETPLGWCVFGQMPLNLPPMIPNAPPQAQPQAVPVMVSLKGEMFFMLGYRWECPALDEVNKFNLPDAYLCLFVRSKADLEKAQAAAQAGLVRAPAGAIDALDRRPLVRN